MRLQCRYFEFCGNYDHGTCATCRGRIKKGIPLDTPKLRGNRSYNKPALIADKLGQDVGGYSREFIIAYSAPMEEKPYRAYKKSRRGKRSAEQNRRYKIGDKKRQAHITATLHEVLKRETNDHMGQEKSDH